MYSGLSQEEAKERLLVFGYNELPDAESKNLFKIAAEAAKEPMFLLLLGCAILYLFIGEIAEGIILLFWVLFVVALTFYQHRKTERALAVLRNLSTPRAQVFRSGIPVRIPGREVVPDDIVSLNTGDRIPADGQLLESINLQIDEAILTGESLPVQKSSTKTALADSYVFSGTLVVAGRGIFKVTHTADRTAFGKIGKSLKEIPTSNTQLHKEIKLLTKNLLIAGIGLSVLVMIAFWVTRGNPITALLNGLATAMAMLPEEFPVVLTVFLAIGSWRLSRKSVLVRNPEAIETLGAATVLCSDKTGTITRNSMEVVTIVTPTKNLTPDKFLFHTLEIQGLLITALGASQTQPTDPMEKALSLLSKKLSISPDLPLQLIREYPVTSENPMLIRVFQEEEAQCRVYCKGAPERVLELCKISSVEKENILDQIRMLGNKGQRVLGVASTRLEANTLPESPTSFSLQWEGLLGFEDPIRPEVPEAIQQCVEAGIRVMLITGDYPETALAIAKQAGLSNTHSALSGSDIALMHDELFSKSLETTDVFARFRPEDKLRLVQNLKKMGGIVCMTGDGVNDAPALKMADIGIGMGEKGTDVARESADLVLLDDNFRSIVSAIRLGRKIYDNLQKALTYVTAIHIPIIGLTLLPAFFSSLPVLLLPLHIVFLELIIDPICALAFESEQEELNLMRRPPRNKNEAFFGIKKFLSSMWSGFILWLMVTTIALVTKSMGYSEGQIRVLCFTGLVVGNAFLILNTLSKTRSIISTVSEKNTPLWIIFTVAAGLLTAILTIPELQAVFGFEFPGVTPLLSSLLGPIGVLFILEITKIIRNKSEFTSKSVSFR